MDDNSGMQLDRDYPRTEITAGILAGGLGRRMGGCDKGLVELDGRPMVEDVLARVQGQAGHILINANRNIPRYEAFGVPVVPDEREGFCGPLAGIETLMAHATTPWLLVVPCDAPQLAPDLGLRLWRAAAAQKTALAIAHSGARIEPVFALLRCALRPTLDKYLAAGGRSLQGWYGIRPAALADFSDCQKAFVNINTREERVIAAKRKSPCRNETRL